MYCYHVEEEYRCVHIKQSVASAVNIFNAPKHHHESSILPIPFVNISTDNTMQREHESSYRNVFKFYTVILHNHHITNTSTLFVLALKRLEWPVPVRTDSYSTDIAPNPWIPWLPLIALLRLVKPSTFMETHETENEQSGRILRIRTRNDKKFCWYWNSIQSNMFNTVVLRDFVVGMIWRLLSLSTEMAFKNRYSLQIHWTID